MPPKRAAPGLRYVQQARLRTAFEPLPVDHRVQQRFADRTAQMLPPLGPIDARLGDGRRSFAKRNRIDAQRREKRDAGGRDRKAGIEPLAVAALHERIRNRNGEPPRQVIVTGARGRQTAASAAIAAAIEFLPGVLWH